MATKDSPFTMTSGDRIDLKFTIRDNARALVNLTGCTARWALATSNKGEIRSSKSETDGITIPVQTGGNLGILTVALYRADTESLEGTYYHELEITDSGGINVTPSAGRVTILASVLI